MGAIMLYYYRVRRGSSFFFFFNDTATTEIYTLSLHDALPISRASRLLGPPSLRQGQRVSHRPPYARRLDRKSTRLNSSHSQISYAVFCLKKKNEVPLKIRPVESKNKFHVV